MDTKNFLDLSLEKPTENDSVLLDALFGTFQRILNDSQGMCGARGPHVVCYAFMTTAGQVYIQTNLTKEQFMTAAEHAWNESLKAEADRIKGERLDG